MVEDRTHSDLELLKSPEMLDYGVHQHPSNKRHQELECPEDRRYAQHLAFFHGRLGQPACHRH